MIAVLFFCWGLFSLAQECVTPSCCSVGVGCDVTANEVVTKCVCNFDPYCCLDNDNWDQQCVDEAKDRCGLICKLRDDSRLQDFVPSVDNIHLRWDPRANRQNSHVANRKVYELSSHRLGREREYGRVVSLVPPDRTWRDDEGDYLHVVRGSFTYENGKLQIVEASQNYTFIMNTMNVGGILDTSILFSEMRFPVRATLLDAASHSVMQVVLKSRVDDSSFEVLTASQVGETVTKANHVIFSADDPYTTGLVYVNWLKRGEGSVDGVAQLEKEGGAYEFNRADFSLQGFVHLPSSFEVSMKGVVLTPNNAHELNEIQSEGVEVNYKQDLYSYDLDGFVSQALFIAWTKGVSIPLSERPTTRAGTVVPEWSWPVCDTCATSVHTAFGDTNGNGMVVSYTTLKMPSEVTVTVGGRTFRGKSRKSASPHSVKYFHHVEITDLQPLTTYTFTVFEEGSRWVCTGNTNKKPCTFPSQYLTKTHYTPYKSFKLHSDDIWCFTDYVSEWDYCSCEPAPARTYSFKTAPSIGHTGAFNVIVYGDLGLDIESNAKCEHAEVLNFMGNEMPFTMQRVSELAASTDADKPDFVLHLGDISYADDYYIRPDSLGNKYENTWDIWMYMMSEGLPTMSTLPYMTLPGNHEVTCSEAAPLFCPQSQRNFTVYNERFNMPSRQSGGNSNMWYSFDHGLVHFVQIDTESNFPNSPNIYGPYKLGGGNFWGNQVEWLRNDLEKAHKNRDKVPWIIVSGHRPFFSSWTSASTVCYQCREPFLSLFMEFDVDLYFAAHIHTYERLWPMNFTGMTRPFNSFKESAAQGCPKAGESYHNVKGPVMLTHGSAGNREMLECPPTPLLPCTSKILSDDYGYGRLFVESPTELRWEFYYSENNTLQDTITITKDPV